MNSYIDAGQIAEHLGYERDRGRLGTFLDRSVDLDGVLIRTRETSRGGRTVSERVIEMTVPIRWADLGATFVLRAVAPNRILMYHELEPDDPMYTTVGNDVWRWLLDRYRESAAGHGVDIDANGTVIMASLRPASKPRSKGVRR